MGYTFNRQKPLGNYIVDFYCKKLNLVIEVDGYSHDDKQKYDHKRQQWLESLGLHVIRFYDHDVMHHIDGVMQELVRKMRQLENT